MGSPPHLRGKHWLGGGHVGFQRITPAPAGKTVPFPLCLLIFQDHPRTCGENTKKARRYVMILIKSSTVHLTFYISHKSSNSLPTLCDDLKYLKKNSLQLYLTYNLPHQKLCGEKALMCQYMDYET